MEKVQQGNTDCKPPRQDYTHSGNHSLMENVQQGNTDCKPPNHSRYLMENATARQDTDCKPPNHSASYLMENVQQRKILTANLLTTVVI